MALSLLFLSLYMNERRVIAMSRVARILNQTGGQPPNILKTLLVVQAELGYVPPASVPEIAAALGVTDADVAGVLSFYPDLRTKAPGRHVVRVCLGESCVANHCRRTLKELEEGVGCSSG